MVDMQLNQTKARACLRTERHRVHGKGYLTDTLFPGFRILHSLLGDLLFKVEPVSQKLPCQKQSRFDLLWSACVITAALQLQTHDILLFLPWKQLKWHGCYCSKIYRSSTLCNWRLRKSSFKSMTLFWRTLDMHDILELNQ